jgi:hypothetical protein
LIHRIGVNVAQQLRRQRQVHPITTLHRHLRMLTHPLVMPRQKINHKRHIRHQAEVLKTMLGPIPPQQLLTLPLGKRLHTKIKPSAHKLGATAGFRHVTRPSRHLAVAVPKRPTGLFFNPKDGYISARRSQGRLSRTPSRNAPPIRHSNEVIRRLERPRDTTSGPPPVQVAAGGEVTDRRQQQSPMTYSSCTENQTLRCAPPA